MKKISKTILVLGTIFCTYFFVHTSFAQDFGGGYELSGGEGDEANFFLQKAVEEDNSLKSKAEQFNGARSGVYTEGRLSCPYAFERDLFVGSSGEDVRLLQILLNSDRRTLISVTGSGSLGQESDNFGESTKEAVKKFQALFIEYTGVANGRFGPRTRTVMNAICNGENKPSNANSIEARQNRNIYDNIFSVQRGAVPGGIATIGTNGDAVAPRVSLSANVSSIKMGETFKVILNASEEIVPISPDSLIVDGGTVKEIRKLSKTSYTATIIINEEEGVKKVLVQVEADKIEDLSGNKNENASNEISVKVITETKVAKAGEGVEEELSINSILDKIISSAPTCTYNGSGILVTVSPDGKPVNTTGCATSQTQNLAGSGQTYNCNGQQIPVTQPCQNQQTQTVCTTSINPVTGFPQQQCQQMTQQQAQAQQAAAQQAQQNQDFGRILGSLLKGQGFGQGANGQGNPGGGPFGGGGGGGGGGIPASVPTTPAQVIASQKLGECMEKNKNIPDHAVKCQAEIDALKNENAKAKTTGDTTDAEERLEKAREALNECRDEKKSNCDKEENAVVAAQDLVEQKEKAEKDAWEKENEKRPFFAADPNMTKVLKETKFLCLKTEAECKNSANWQEVKNNLYSTTYNDEVSPGKQKFFFSKSAENALDKKEGFLPSNVAKEYIGFSLCETAKATDCNTAGNSHRNSGKLYVQNTKNDNSRIEKAFVTPTTLLIQGSWGNLKE